MNGAVLLRWVWLWMQGLFPSVKVAHLDFDFLREMRVLVDHLIIGLEQLWVGFQFGTVLARSVAWGVLGV